MGRWMHFAVGVLYILVWRFEGMEGMEKGGEGVEWLNR